MMDAPTPIYDISDIDLDKHAVIKASAGTGKTYTIQHLIVELVLKKGLTLDQILVVTYTEKATGELRQRVRSQLLQALQDEEDLPADEQDMDSLNRLRQASDAFDTAAIYTIHGFCMRMLQQYAFENRSALEQELLDDGEIYRQVLNQLMSRDWPRRHGKALLELLELTGFSKNAEAWAKEIIELAKKYRPQCRDILLPTCQELDFETLTETLRQKLGEIADLAGIIAPLDASDCWLRHCYDDLNINASSRNSILNMQVEPLISLLARETSTIGLKDWLETLDACSRNGKFKTEGFLRLRSPVTGGKSEDLNRLDAIVKKLMELHELIQEKTLQGMFRVNAVTELVERGRQLKASQGAISYEDMLTNVHENLYRESDGENRFLSALQSRFRYAIVDEFQDTDTLQWEIFRIVFTSSEQHRLFLIGDPKQAIYGFRGADLNTYLNATQTLLREEDAHLYALPTNYRSVPDLLDSFNRIFGCEHWFPEADGIVYRPVAAPDPDVIRSSVSRDDSGRDALTVIPLTSTKKGEQQTDLHRWIAREIRWLIGDRLEISTNREEPRPLSPRDICVLVQTHSEARSIHRTLMAQGIPVSFYKQAGLYASDQALQLSFVLRAVINPQDRGAVSQALLTRIFEITPKQLAEQPAQTSDDPRMALIDQWHFLATKRLWAQLFQSILEDSGLLLREQILPDGERRVANYRHLVQELHMLATQEKHDLVDLVDQLDYRRLGIVQLDGDADLQRLETEEPKVRVMTIHASKGLEFPVVFLGGALGNGVQSNYYRFHRDNSVHYDLAMSSENQAAHDAERAAGDQRLLYVALTRASHKLYLPYLTEGKNKSCVNVLLSPVLRQTRHTESIGMNPEGYYQATSPQTIDSIPRDETARIVLPSPLLPPINDSIRHRRIPMVSFSSLHQVDAPETERPLDAFSVLDSDQAWRVDDESSTVRQTTESEDPLPAGASTGNVVHELFEVLDWRSFDVQQPETLLEGDSRIAQVLDTKLADYGVLEGLGEKEAQAARVRLITLLHRTLTTPLPEIGLRLVDLSTQDRLHEVEFHFHLPAKREESIPEVMTMGDGFVHGYIDLLFRYQGRYYLLDWKSNLLREGYGASAVESSMTQEDYHLQYRLYAVAVRRWLGDKADQLAGAFYLYVRGITTESPGAGVFYRDL